MLLCIEMAIFAVMHLFAFPWKDYDLSSPSYRNPIMAPGHGFSGAKPEYKGGKFGLKAWMNAFNPWDIVKASARGFRWLVIGRKYRHHDVSYRPSQVVSPIDVPRTPDAVLPATELLGRGRADTFDQTDDVQAGLLSSHTPSHAQNRTISPTPIRQESYESQPGTYTAPAGPTYATATPGTYAAPVGTTYAPAHPAAGAYAGANYTAVMPTPGLPRLNIDTGYNAAPGAPSVGQMPTQGNGGPWDHWAGARGV